MLHMYMDMLLGATATPQMRSCGGGKCPQVQYRACAGTHSSHVKVLAQARWLTMKFICTVDLPSLDSLDTIISPTA